MGPIAQYRRTIHHTRMRQEVDSRVMRAEAIIPERNVSKFPAPPNCELWLGHMFEQERQQVVALFGRKLQDPGGEALIDEEPTATTLDRPNNRVHDRRIRRHRFLPLSRLFA